MNETTSNNQTQTAQPGYTFPVKVVVEHDLRYMEMLRAALIILAVWFGAKLIIELIKSAIYK